MRRKKVELQWIALQSARNASLRRRREELMKKMEEITTLCGVEGCTIVYSPDDNQIVQYPSGRGTIEGVLDRFQVKPKEEQRKNMTTQEGYLIEMKEKLGNDLANVKFMVKEMEMEMDEILHEINGNGRWMGEWSREELIDLLRFLEWRKYVMLGQGMLLEMENNQAGPLNDDAVVPADVVVPPPPPPQFPLDPPLQQAVVGSGLAEEMMVADYDMNPYHIGNSNWHFGSSSSGGGDDEIGGNSSGGGGGGGGGRGDGAGLL